MKYDKFAYHSIQHRMKSQSQVVAGLREDLERGGMELARVQLEQALILETSSLQ